MIINSIIKGAGKVVLDGIYKTAEGVFQTITTAWGWTSNYRWENVECDGDDLVLSEESEGVYEATGERVSNPILIPAHTTSNIQWEKETDEDTDVKVYTGVTDSDEEEPAIIPKTDIAGYWALDESSGNASDSYGDTTLTNNNSVSYISGLIGNAADFGTNNTNKSLSNTTRIGSVNDDKTFALWVKINTDLSGSNDIYTCIFEWAFGGSGNNVGYRIRYDRISSINYFRVVRDRGCVGTDAIYYGPVSSEDDWYHIAGVLSGTKLTMYVNGKDEGSVTINTGNGSCNSQDGIYIGCNRDSSGFASVVVDEVGIWNRALTQEKITTLYNNGAGISYDDDGNWTKAINDSTIPDLVANKYLYCKQVLSTEDTSKTPKLNSLKIKIT